jgi:hypothetical protein
VTTFLSLVREESYQEAYDGSSYILREAYTYEQFLMVAGKLQMEEMPCFGDAEVQAMEPTSGHVGIGPKDISVKGFLVRYSCDDQDRVLIILLDWSGIVGQPSGVASLYWK